MQSQLFTLKITTQEGKVMATRLILTSPVTITGPNFWGWPSRLDFLPTGQPGWFWQPTDEEDVIGIDSRITEAGCRNIQLRYGSYTLPVYEHLGAVRALTGLDQVLIRGNGWPPYHGRSAEIWWALRDHATLVKSDSPTVWQAGIPAKVTHSKIPNGYIHYEPWGQERLELIMLIDYPGLGSHEHRHIIPDNDISLVVEAFSQGWPPELKPISEFAGTLGWPHSRRVVWPNGDSAKETLFSFGLHRTDDLAGTASLFHYSHRLRGRIVSYGSGHASDLELIKLISQTG